MFHFIHFRDFAVSIMQLYVTLDCLSNSLKFLKFQTHNPKAKPKFKKGNIADTYFQLQYVLAKPLQPSLMFVGMAKGLP
jgi:hypothetical protein